MSLIKKYRFSMCFLCEKETGLSLNYHGNASFTGTDICRVSSGIFRTDGDTCSTWLFSHYTGCTNKYAVCFFRKKPIIFGDIDCFTFQSILDSLRIRPRRLSVKEAVNGMETLLPTVTVHRNSLIKTPQEEKAGEVCLLVESPYRILRVRAKYFSLVCS